MSEKRGATGLASRASRAWRLRTLCARSGAACRATARLCRRATQRAARHAAPMTQSRRMSVTRRASKRGLAHAPTRRKRTARYSDNASRRVVSALPAASWPGLTCARNTYVSAPRDAAAARSSGTQRHATSCRDGTHQRALQQLFKLAVAVVEACRGRGADVSRTPARRGGRCGRRGGAQQGAQASRAAHGGGARRR